MISFSDEPKTPGGASLLAVSLPPADVQESLNTFMSASSEFSLSVLVVLHVFSEFSLRK